MNDFLSKLKAARCRLLQMHYEAQVGHLGGNLSALDILMVLFHRVLREDDVFILSKGHAAGALYTALWSVGKLTDADLLRFHQDGTQLSAHPPPCWHPAIPFATGSLGHGLPLANGIALGKYLQNQPGRVFCLLSDGEMQEGATWEGVIFAKHHRTAPLTIIIDANQLQGFGSTQEVAGLELTVRKFCEFGLAAEEIDGHDVDAITAACARESTANRVIIAHTRKGARVSFMENRMEWHYLPMSEAQYRQALKEVNAS
jgi:transketolase